MDCDGFMEISFFGLYHIEAWNGRFGYYRFPWDRGIHLVGFFEEMDIV